MPSETTSHALSDSTSSPSELDRKALSQDALDETALIGPAEFENLIAAIQVLDAPRYADDDRRDNVERLNDAMLEALGSIERVLGMFVPNLIASRLASGRLEDQGANGRNTLRAGGL